MGVALAKPLQAVLSQADEEQTQLFDAARFEAVSRWEHKKCDS